MNKLQLIEEVNKLFVDNTDNPLYHEKIKELEKNGAKVFHVIPRHKLVFGFGDEVEMTEYLVIFKEDFQAPRQFLNDLKNGYVYAWAENHDWGVMGSEFGSIAIKNINGYAKRVG